MKRQRAALGMAVMMAVSSLSGSYVSASAMETWQADAMILEEDIFSGGNLEEIETESESESGLDGVSNGLQIVSIAEMPQADEEETNPVQVQSEMESEPDAMPETQISEASEELVESEETENYMEEESELQSDVPEELQTEPEELLTVEALDVEDEDAEEVPSYELSFDYAYGDQESGSYLFYGDRSEPQVLTLNTEPLEGFEDYKIDWQVTQYPCGSEKPDGVFDCAEYEISEDRTAITLTATGVEAKRLNVCAVVRVGEGEEEKEVAWTDAWLDVIPTELRFDSIESYVQLLPGEEYSIDSEYPVSVRDPKHPNGGEVPVSITEVKISGRTDLFKDINGDHDSEGRISLSPVDEEGNYSVHVKNNGISEGGEATLLCYYRSKGETVNFEGQQKVQLSVASEKYEADYHINGGDNRLLPGESVKIETFLERASYDAGREENDYGQNIEGYQIRLGSEWSSETIDVSVDENDETVLNVTAKPRETIQDVKDGENWILVDFVYNDVVVAHCDIPILVEEDYYVIRPEKLLMQSGEDGEWEQANPLVGETIDLGEFDIHTEHYFLPEGSEEEISLQNSITETEENIRYRVEWDEDAWQKVPGEETVQQSEEEESEDEEPGYGLPTLLRTSNRNTWIRVYAEKNFAGDGEEERWKEVHSREYWFGWIDYNSGFDFSYESNTDGENILFYGERSERLTVSLNWDEMNDLDPDEIQWEVRKCSKGNPEGTPVEEEEISVENPKDENNNIDKKSIVLSVVDEKEYDDTWLHVCATIEKYGKVISENEYDIDLARTEFHDDALPGDDRILPGWPYDVDKSYMVRVKDPQHPWSEDVSVEITEVWIKDPNKAFIEDGNDGNTDIKLQPDENGNYHIQAIVDNTKPTEGSATLTYIYEWKENEIVYSGEKTVAIEVISDRYDPDYSYSTRTEHLLRGESVVIDTSLYHSWYDVDEDHEDREDVEEYRISLGKNEEGEPDWNTDLVDVTIDENNPRQIHITAKAEAEYYDGVSIPIQYLIDENEVANTWIWIDVTKDYYKIEPAELLADTGEGEETEMLNPLVGESIAFGSKNISAKHYNAGLPDKMENVTVDGKHFRYRMEYDSNAWVAEELSEGEENGNLIGLHTLQRIRNWDTPVRIILEEYVEYEADGENRGEWEERTERDYWFSEADYEPSFAFSYGEVTSEKTENPGIYTDGKSGLTVTWRTKTEVNLKGAELIEEPTNEEMIPESDGYFIQWSVYSWDEDGNKIRAEYVAPTLSEDMRSVTLKLTGENIEEHRDESFDVRAVLYAYGAEVAWTETSVQVKNPEYRFMDDDMADAEIYLLARSKNSWMFKSDKTENFYQENEEHPDGLESAVYITDIDYAEKDTDAAGKIVELKKDGDGIWIRPGEKPGQVSLEFKLSDENGKKLSPIYFTVYVDENYYTIDAWHIESKFNAGTQLLPGETMTVAPELYYEEIDQNGEIHRTELEEGTDYYIKFCNYDDTVIEVEDNVIHAKNRGETGLGVLFRDKNNPDEATNVLHYAQINVYVKGVLYSISPTEIDEIVLAPKDDTVDIPLTATKWSISHPNGEEATKDVTYTLPEEMNDYRKGLTAEIRQTEDGTPALHLEFGTDTDLKKGEQAEQWIQFYGSVGEDVVAQRAFQITLCNHDAKELARTKATCTTDGYIKYQCDTCGTEWEETLQATGHDLTKTEAKAATCTEAGNNEYWSCSKCDGVFADENATQETTVEAQTISAMGHKLTKTEAKAATCTEAGNKEYWSCSECDGVFADENATQETSIAQQTIPATGHSPVTDAAVAATCTTAGKTAGSHCSVCNTVLEAQQTIPATGHSPVTDAAVAATCTTAGKTAGSHCSVCNTVLEAQQTVPAKGHSWSAWKTVSEATISAAAVQERSCTTCGTTQRQNAGSALSPKLTLNATSITLKTKQKTKKVQVTGLAAGDAVDSWISSDEKVVKVSGTAAGTCTITAQKKTGNATIYVKLKSGLTGTIQVKVQKKKVAATKVVVAEKTVNLQKGQKQKINAYIQPLTTEDKLTFTSSNKKVATVSKDGTITAKKAGKANITVKAGKKKVTVKVTVQAPAPTGINGVPATKTLKKGKSFTIKPKLTPSGAEAKITYSSSNKKVATVNAKGKVTAKGKGTAVITVKAGSIVRTCEIIVK